jgi:hypothetical protein
VLHIYDISSLRVNMLLSAVSVLVVVQLSSEVPEGLMNYPVYLGSFFLDPEDVQSLCLSAIWNCSEGTGRLWADIRLWGS